MMETFSLCIHPGVITLKLKKSPVNCAKMLNNETFTNTVPQNKKMNYCGNIFFTK